MLVLATDYSVAAVANMLGPEPERPLQASYINASSGLEIDHWSALYEIVFQHADLFDINVLSEILIPRKSHICCVERMFEN